MKTLSRELTKPLAIVLLSTIALSAPLGALAQRRGGGGGGGQAAPRAASAPARSGGRTQGFDLHEDIAPPARSTAPVRPVTPPRPANPVHENAPVVTQQHDVASRPPATAHRPALIGNLGYGGQPGGRRVIRDPRYQGAPWGWNHGVTWNPAPRYWGGGFWGPWALGIAAAGIFGYIAYDDETLTSYQVEPDSPGAQLLDNYQLTQVPCGPPDLVVIFGPDDSAICADPNDSVAAGEYQLDPSDLTIVSLDQ
jgi:hypothetical protein